MIGWVGAWMGGLVGLVVVVSGAALVGYTNAGEWAGRRLVLVCWHLVCGLVWWCGGVRDMMLWRGVLAATCVVAWHGGVCPMVEA
jgi:hypothetical protein